MRSLRCAVPSSAVLQRGAARLPRGRWPCDAVRCSASASAAVTPVVCFYADWAEVPLPPGHRFPMHKYATTRLQLADDPSLAGRLDLRRSPLVSLDDLRRVHSSAYVDNVLAGALSAEQQRVLGFPWSEAHVTRSLASTGGTVAAMHLVMSGLAQAPPPGVPRRPHRAAMQLAGAFALNRAASQPVFDSLSALGGTHHAFREHGEGFCACVPPVSAVCAL